MKQYLLITFALIPLHSLCQIEFTGYIQDDRTRKPISNAQITAIGADVSAENIWTTDNRGFFIIKFDSKSINKTFTLRVTQRDYKPAEFSEVVATVRQPKTYQLTSRSAPVLPAVPAKSKPEEIKKQNVIADGNPQQQIPDNPFRPHAKIDTAKNYPFLKKDTLNVTGDRYLTDADKRLLQEQLTDHKLRVYVCYHRLSKESQEYAKQIVEYVTRNLGFSGNTRFYQPPATGRFDVEKTDRQYNVNVLVRVQP